MAHLIKSDGGVERIQPDQPNGKFSLKRMQELVGGDIQITPPLRMPIIIDDVKYRQHIYFDMDGKNKNRPVNLQASVLWLTALNIELPQRVTVDDLLMGAPDFLVGDVLFTESSEVE